MTKPVAGVGDLVIVRMKSVHGWPLRVARVLKLPPTSRRGPKSYLLHWYGNYAGAPLGSHTPGWKDGQQTWYFKKEPNQPGHRALTSVETAETILVQHICQYVLSHIEIEDTPRHFGTRRGGR